MSAASVLCTPELLDLVLRWCRLRHLVYVKRISSQWCASARRTLTSRAWICDESNEAQNRADLGHSIQTNYWRSPAPLLPLQIILHSYCKSDPYDSVRRQDMPVLHGVLHELRINMSHDFPRHRLRSETLVWNHPTAMIVDRERLDLVSLRLEVPGYGMMTSLLDLHRLLEPYEMLPQPDRMLGRNVISSFERPHPLDCIFPAVILDGLTVCIWDEDFVDVSLLSMCLRDSPPSELVAVTE